MERSQLLLHMYQDQRDQLAFRRAREDAVFTWTATLLLAFVGAALLVGADDRPALLRTPGGVALASLSLALLTAFSVTWQLKQRRLMAEHQKRLVAIQEDLGCFSDDRAGEARFPEEWRGWGRTNVTLRERLLRPSKIAATVLIGALGIVAAVLGGT